MRAVSTETESSYQVSMEMDRLVKSMVRLRIFHRSSGAHAGDNSDLSILNNGGKAGNKLDSKDEVRAAWAQSIKLFRAVG